jgi:hypothetical protein
LPSGVLQRSCLVGEKQEKSVYRSKVPAFIQLKKLPVLAFSRLVKLTTLRRFVKRRQKMVDIFALYCDNAGGIKITIKSIFPLSFEFLFYI